MRKRFFVSGLVIFALAAACAFALRSKALRSDTPLVKTQNPSATVTMIVDGKEARMKIFNNTINNAWVNVPIEVASLGGHNFRVTNKTKWGIKRFIIVLYAAFVGKPFHGEGAERHRVLVQVTDRPIEQGKSIDINIEKQLGEFSSGAHGHAVDMNRIEMLPYVIDFADEDGGKRWFGGKYLRLTGPDTWDEDPDLNPKENKDLIGITSSTQGCWVYDSPSMGPCTNCNTGDATCDTPFCRKPVFKFKTNRGGVGKALTCYRCSQDAPGGCIFGIQCAHDDGSPCIVMVLDLDYNHPC